VGRGAGGGGGRGWRGGVEGGGGGYAGGGGGRVWGWGGEGESPPHSAKPVAHPAMWNAQTGVAWRAGLRGTCAGAGALEPIRCSGLPNYCGICVNARRYGRGDRKRRTPLVGSKHRVSTKAAAVLGARAGGGGGGTATGRLKTEGAARGSWQWRARTSGGAWQGATVGVLYAKDGPGSDG